MCRLCVCCVCVYMHAYTHILRNFPIGAEVTAASSCLVAIPQSLLWDVVFIVIRWEIY